MAFTCKALLLQPTFTCAKNCSGCYVKERESSVTNKEMSTRVWADFFRDIFNGTSVQTEQITMALDDLPGDPEIDRVSARMFYIATNYLYAAKESQFRKDGGQVHITVNTVNDAKKYNFEEGYENAIDLVSISNLTSVEQIRELKSIFGDKIKVNWNVLSTSMQKMNPEVVRQLVRNVDSVNFLLHKDKLGGSGHQTSAFYTARDWLAETLKEKGAISTDGAACSVPPLRDKVYLDNCVTSSEKFNKVGTGCSANISKFHVWPDGQVSGCPYNSHTPAGLQAAQSFEEVLVNLQAAKTRYEFNSCSIPKLLDRKSLPMVSA